MTEIPEYTGENWLEGICDFPTEVRVTPAGTRKLPGRPREYANGDGVYFTREAYVEWTKGLIGIEIDPCRAWFIDMGHGPVPNDVR